MTTNIKPGQKIRIAVPLSPGDDTPIAKRETRISTVEEITDAGIIRETEGSVRADRMGIDWESLEGDDAAGRLVVVRLASGPIFASVTTVEGNTVKLYSDHIPPGPFSVRARDCAKCWDWLRGRSMGEVFVTLPEILDLQTMISAPAAVAVSAAGPSEGKAGKKRGPKPRGPAVTTTTEVLPATPPATIAAADRRIAFMMRMRLWHEAKDLVSLLESEADDSRLCEAIGKLGDTITGLVGVNRV